MPYCVKEELLASIYGFTHLGCSALQEQAAIEGFYRIWERFVASLVRFYHLLLGLVPGIPSTPLLGLQAVKGKTTSWPTVADLAALRSAVSFVGKGSCTWFGEYGCALLALRPAEAHYQPVDTVTLLLVGLDKWEFAVHR